MSAWLIFVLGLAAALLALGFVTLLVLASIADENEGLPWPLDGEDDL